MPCSILRAWLECQGTARGGKIPTYESRIRSSATASTLLQEYLADTDREHFVILMLDQKHQVIGMNTVSIGSLTASVVHPRGVLNGHPGAASIVPVNALTMPSSFVGQRLTWEMPYPQCLRFCLSAGIGAHLRRADPRSTARGHAPTSAASLFTPFSG
jgi:hypothetical protein